MPAWRALAVGHLKTCANFCRGMRLLSSLAWRAGGGRATWWTMQQCPEVMPRTSRRKEAIHIHRWIERTNERTRWPRFASHCTARHSQEREREGGREENDPPPMATRAGGGELSEREVVTRRTGTRPGHVWPTPHAHNQAHAEEEIARWTDAELILVLTIYHQ